MKASEISASIETLINIRRPAFLWGPPGIGKSQVVRQTAQGMGLDLIDIRAVLLDPVDLRGLPRISPEGLSQWCVPAFLPQKGRGILFLDELNAAPPLVQAACYQLVLDRRLGEYVMPEGWSIIAAGNREQDRAVTHRMPSALANRFVHLDFCVDHGEWLAWAARNRIASEVVDFIRFRPALLHDFDPKQDALAFPTPRSWEFVSDMMAATPALDLLRELVEGAVGKGASAEFIGFVKIRRNLPEPQTILDHPETIEIPEDPGVLYAICEMLGQSVQEDSIKAMITFASRLPAEFSVLLIREAVRKNNDIVNTSAFTNWAACHADVLI